MLWLALVALVAAVAAATPQLVRELPFFARSESRLTISHASLAPPSPRERIRVTVDLAVTYDAERDYYTYAFTVANAHNAQNAVEVFGVADVEEPLSWDSPPQWMAGYGYQEKDKAIVWANVDTLTPEPPNWSPGQPYPSPFDIQPGETKTGLRFRTRNPPISFSFYAQGFDTLPHEKDLVDTEYEYPSLFTVGVRGEFVVLGVPDSPLGERGAVELLAPRPNPAPGRVSFGFRLPAEAEVALAVYDVSGRRVRQVLAGRRPAGWHAITWDGSTEAGARAPPGVYFARLLVDGRRAGEQRVTVLP